MSESRESVDWQIGSGVQGAEPLEPGFRVGRYKLERPLGEGAAGQVYRARGPLGLVALKLSQPQASSHAQARFLREGQLLASLRHPGLVGVHDVGEADGRVFLACELIEGGRPLDEAWAGLGLRARVAWLRDVARAVGCAHAAGIVHRDLKPANVLVGDDGRPRVIDFGVGLSRDLATLTVSGTRVGTPYWMPPEQAIGDREAVGPRSDVWSLGVLLYQALTERLPFEGEGLVELMAMIVGGEPPPPSQVDPSVPPALEAVCLRALRNDPADRYASGQALATALEAWLTWPEPPPPPSQSRAAWLGVAVAVCFGGLTAAWVHQPPRQPSPQPAAAEPSSSTPAERAPTTPGYRQRLLTAARAGAWSTARAALEAWLADPQAETPRRGALVLLSEGWAGGMRELNSPAHGAFMEGWVEFACGEFARAEVLFDAFLRQRPTVPMGLRMRGIARLEQGRVEAGLADLGACLELDPAFYLARADRARAYAQLGRLQEALADADSVLAGAPTMDRSRLLRLRLRAGFGDSLGALADAQELQARAARIPRGDLLRAAADLCRFGANDAALLLANDLLAGYPDDLEGLKLRGFLLFELGRSAAALVDLDRYLAISPDDPQVRYARARTRHALGRPSALEDIEAALTLEPRLEGERLSSALLLRSQIRWDAGDVAGAARELEAALLELPADWPERPRVRRSLEVLRKRLASGDR